jgi:hypothetical protein
MREKKRAQALWPEGAGISAYASSALKNPGFVGNK